METKIYLVLVSLVVLYGYVNCTKELNKTYINLDERGFALIESPGYPNYAQPHKTLKRIVLTKGSGFKVNCTASILKSGGCSRGILDLWNIRKKVILCTQFTSHTWEFPGKDLSLWFKTTSCGKGRFSCFFQPLQTIETTSPTGDQVIGNSKQLAKPTSCPCGWTKKSPAVGGQETDVKEYVFVAKIKFKMNKGDDKFCGGSIVSQRHVLTAAHCVFFVNKERSKIEVAVGGHSVDTDSESVKPEALGVRKMYVHEKFSTENRINDIALLVLSRELQFSPSVGPVCLPVENYPLLDQRLTALGWGYGSAKSTTLQSVDLQVMNLTMCADGKYNISLDKPTQLCIFADPEDERIKFDGVGPLVYLDPELDRYVQVGLRSYTDGNRSIHTLIFPFFDWIQSKIEVPVKRKRWSTLLQALSSAEQKEGNSMQYQTCEKLETPPSQYKSYNNILRNL